MKRWAVAGAFVSPKGITNHSKEPSGVLIAVLRMESMLIGICQKNCAASMAVK